MNQRMYILATLIVISSLFLSGCTSSSINSSKIKDINTDPGKYEGTEVTVSGKVIDDGQEIEFGYIIDDGSASIIILSSKVPKLDEQVTVKGIVTTTMSDEVFIDATGNE